MKIAAFYENIEEGAQYEGISVSEAVHKLKKDGLEMLYVGSVPFRNDLTEVETVIKENEIGVEGVHGWVDFAHDPGNLLYKQIILDAVRLHTKNVLIVPGMLQKGDERSAIIHNIKEGMKQAVSFGKEYGIFVSMEDFDGLMAPYCTIEGLAEFLDEIPELMCSFDTGNFIMYQEDEKKAFHRFQDKICTMHLKDRKKERVWSDEQFKICADGSKVYVAPIGQGYIRIKEMLEALKMQNYTGNVIVELYDYSPSHMLEGFRESLQWISDIIK